MVKVKLVVKFHSLVFGCHWWSLDLLLSPYSIFCSRSSSSSQWKHSKDWTDSKSIHLWTSSLNVSSLFSFTKNTQPIFFYLLQIPKYNSIIEYLCDDFSVVEEYLEKTLSVHVSLELTGRWVELGRSCWLVADLCLLWSWYCWVVVSLEWRALGLLSAEEHTAAANTLQLLWSFASSHNHFLTMNKCNYSLYLFI